MLTEAQDNLWRYLYRTSRANNGKMPSYREMSADLGYASISTIHGLVSQLVDRGYALRTGRHRRRGIQLLAIPK
jgi:SOS-response transcriptional repressor LexA